MKKMTKKFISVLISVLIITAACPFTALAAGVVEETIPAVNGTDITDLFNEYTKKAKDDASTTRYVFTIPAGNYTCDQLKVWGNTTVKMYGATITHVNAAGRDLNEKPSMIRFGNKMDWDAANGGAGYPGYSSPYSNISFEGGTLDGNGLGQALIRFAHSTNINISGVTFRNVKDAHMIEFGGCSGVNITGCTFADFSSSNWGSAQNYEALQIEALTSQGSHFSGYTPNGDETPCENINVTGCTFSNLQRGVGTHTGIANSYFNNINISNNTFNNITGFAIIATNYKNSFINSNTITNCGSGILFRAMDLSYKNFYPSSKGSSSRSAYEALNSQVAYNSISVTPGYKAVFNNVAYGIQLAGENLGAKSGSAPAGDWRVAGVNVTGNSITLNSTGYALWLVGAVANNISANTINCNIVQQAKGGNGDGIRLEKSNANSVTSNTVSNVTASGSLAKNLSGITLCQASSSNNVSFNVINSAKKDGIHIEKKSNSNTVASNTVSKSGRDGIHIETSNSLKVNSNSILNTKRNGISIKSIKKISFTSNKISKCKTDGIHIEKSSKVSLVKNKIKGYKRYGILATKKQIKKDSKNKISKGGKKVRSWKK